MGKNIKYIIYKEGKFYVSKCLNVEVASFGETIEEAKENLMEAVYLYFEDDDIDKGFNDIGETIIGENKLEV